MFRVVVVLAGFSVRTEIKPDKQRKQNIGKMKMTVAALFRYRREEISVARSSCDNEKKYQPLELFQ